MLKQLPVQYWRQLIWQWLRYCLVGLVNTLIDILILNALLWCLPTTNVQILVVYNSLAYAGGAVSSLFLNKYWTFSHRQKLTGREVRRFVISMILEILLTNGLVWLAGSALRPLIANVLLWGNLSKLLAMAGNTVLSYLIMRFWVFAGDPTRKQTREQTEQLIAPSDPDKQTTAMRKM
jgi:putative flippase GtrA